MGPARDMAGRRRAATVTDQRRRAIILRLGVVLFGRCGWPTAGKHAVFQTRHIHQITSESLQSNRRLRARTYFDRAQLGGGLGRVGSVDYQAKADQVGMAGL
jgi:hypothetical protein